MTDGPISYDLSADSRRLVLHGELDEPATADLRALVTGVIAGLADSDPSAGMEIDLSDVDFFPSAAVGVLAKARSDARSRGLEIVFVAAEGTIAQRVLTICRLPHVTR